MKSLLFVLLLKLLFLGCDPAEYTVVTDDPSKYAGEGISKFYVINKIDTLKLKDGSIKYRVRIQEIPKDK
jgi:hypothetical protein